jgi:hypothetical protein
VVTVGVEPGEFLGSNGNATSCQTAYPSVSQVSLECNATGSPASGPTGGGTLARLEVLPRTSLEVRPAENNAQSVALDALDQVVVLRDVGGAALALANVGDAVLAVRALEGDVTRDCAVTTADEVAVAARYGSELGDGAYDAYYDVAPEDADGAITIADIQFVSGRQGSTCAAPVPPQPPSSLDSDGDGMQDHLDNCPQAHNAAQDNTDGRIGNGAGMPTDDLTSPNGDGLGDACDDDQDNDGLANGEDAAPGGDITYDDDGDGEPGAGCLDGSDADDGPSWDADCDGIRDGLSASACAALSTSVDADDDGIGERAEVCKWGTSDEDVDSDGDGVRDCVEILDVSGDGTADFLSDLLAYAQAALLPPTAFGKDGTYDLDGDNRLDFLGDVLGAAALILLPPASGGCATE